MRRQRRAAENVSQAFPSRQRSRGEFFQTNGISLEGMGTDGDEMSRRPAVARVRTVIEVLSSSPPRLSSRSCGRSHSGSYVARGAITHTTIKSSQEEDRGEGQRHGLHAFCIWRVLWPEKNGTENGTENGRERGGGLGTRWPERVPSRTVGAGHYGSVVRTGTTIERVATI